MKNVNKNRNYKRINNKILNAYNEILLKNGNDNTNITELCKIAKINRTTFYKHYKDLSDINEEIESEFVYNAFSTQDNADIFSFMKNPYPSFKKLNKNVLANKALYKALLRPERLAIFIEKVSEFLIKDILEYRQEFVKIFNNVDEFKMSVYTMVGCICNIYSQWLRDKMKLDIEVLSNRICESIVAIYKHSERYKQFR